MNLYINRFLSAMRNFAGISIIVAFMLCSTDLRAQSKKVTIVSSSITVGQVLKDIESQTGYLFVYNTSDVDVSKKVSLNCKDVAVSQVLERILADQNVKWHLEGRYIKILRQSSEQKDANQSTANNLIRIKGKVSGADAPETLLCLSMLSVSVCCIQPAAGIFSPPEAGNGALPSHHGSDGSQRQGCEVFLQTIHTRAGYKRYHQRS